MCQVCGKPPKRKGETYCWNCGNMRYFLHPTTEKRLTKEVRQAERHNRKEVS